MMDRQAELEFDAACIAEALAQAQKVTLSSPPLTVDMIDHIVEVRALLKRLGAQFAARREYTLTKGRDHE